MTDEQQNITPQQEPKNDGLPAVAEKDKKQLWLIVVFAIAFVLVAGHYFLGSKKATQEVAKVEENFAPTQDKGKPTSVPHALVVANAEQQPPPTKEQLSVIQAKQKELQERLSAPLVVFDNQGNKAQQQTTANQNDTVFDPNTQFMKQTAAATTETAEASRMSGLNYLIAEGSLIHATLESAINSDLPGYIRAVVSNPVYSEDGTQTLIPPGSRLIGQYRSGMIQGQSRIFIVWTRVITPQGVSVMLGSQGVDSLGRAGVGANAIERHFWQTFGNSVLLSIIGAGAANVGVSSSKDQYNSAQAYRTAIASSFAQSASQSLQQRGMIAPTLHVYQGTPIIVFVAKDISFKKALQSPQAKVAVF